MVDWNRSRRFRELPARCGTSSVVRPREVARAVTPLELFFDLVYVFTVSQLAYHLLGHVDLGGGGLRRPRLAVRGHRLHMHFANALAWEIGTGFIWIAGIVAEGTRGWRSGPPRRRSATAV